MEEAVDEMDRLYAEVRSRSVAAPHPAVPAPAVAGILWRAAAELEVYLVQRAHSLGFMGGFWCFPGGRVEPGEGPEAALARELFEEVGITALVAPRPLTRFVTPEISPIRFVADYYLIDASGADPDAARSDGELIAGHWIAPRIALERFARGEWLMPSPVTRSLEALVAGLDDGLAARFDQAGELEQRVVRPWPLAAGLACFPLRTPTLPPATHTNCYLVGSGELVVVDPASPYPDEQRALDLTLDCMIAGGKVVREIWLTHHHGDHVGGAAHLAARLGVPIAAHRETARRLVGRVAVDRELADGDVLELAGSPPRRLRAVFTPGHAPGHLCFLEEVTGFLIAGDMVASASTIVIDPRDGDMRAYLASLERMRDLLPRALLPAHGGPIVDAAGKLATYLEHRRWREARVVAALGPEPRPAAALVPVVYADVDPGLFGLAERSLLAHLVKLEGDGQARQHAGGWARAHG